MGQMAQKLPSVPPIVRFQVLHQLVLYADPYCSCYSTILGAITNWSSTIYVVLAQVYQTTIAKLSIGLALCLLMLGVMNVFFIPLSNSEHLLHLSRTVLTYQQNLAVERSIYRRCCSLSPPRSGWPTPKLWAIFMVLTFFLVSVQLLSKPWCPSPYVESKRCLDRKHTHISLDIRHLLRPRTCDEAFLLRLRPCLRILRRTDLCRIHGHEPRLAMGLLVGYHPHRYPLASLLLYLRGVTLRSACCSP